MPKGALQRAVINRRAQDKSYDASEKQLQPQPGNAQIIPINYPIIPVSISFSMFFSI